MRRQSSCARSRFLFMALIAGALALLGLILAPVGARHPLLPARPPLTALAGAVGESTVGDYVWHDLDVNGDYDDPAEEQYIAGVDGVLVNLYWDKNRNGAIDADEFFTSTLTGDNSLTVGTTETGWYDFNVAAGGTWWIVEIAASNFAPGGPLEGYVHTSAGNYGGVLKPGGAIEKVVILPGSVEDYNFADFGFARAGLDLVKVAGDTPDGETHLIERPGEVVTYTYTLTNTGDTYLASVVITDDNATPLDPADDFLVCFEESPLAPGASVHCAWSRYVDGVQVNVARATGRPVDMFGSELPAGEVTALDEAVTRFHPLSVEVAGFTLTGGDRRVTAAWTTAAEIDNEGFNIYRADCPDGERLKINLRLIAASPLGFMGASYAYVDSGVTNGMTYCYWLGAVDTWGVEDVYALGGVTPRRAGKTR